MKKKKYYKYSLNVDIKRVNIKAFVKLAKINGRSINAEINEAMVNHLKPSTLK